MKLTHWVRKDVADLIIAKADFSIIVDKLGINSVKLLAGREEMMMKPKGFWLSVDGSWEEWVDGSWKSWYENMVCLEAELSKDINLLIINSKKDFLEAYKKYTRAEYSESPISIFRNQTFHKNIMRNYDGIWVKGNVICSYRMDCMYFYSWDAESICVWNKDKLKFKKMIR